MHIFSIGRAVSFAQAKRGSPFRFVSNGKPWLGMKVFKEKDNLDAGLMLEPGHPDIPAESFFGPHDFENEVVLELPDVSLVPAADLCALVMEPAHRAEPGELELVDDKAFLVVATKHGGYYRVDMSTGEVSRSTEARPAIVTRWSLVQTVMGERVALYHHDNQHSVVRAA